MKHQKINAGDYEVHFENASFAALKLFLQKNSFSSYVLLCDKNVKLHCLPVLFSAVPQLNKIDQIVIPAGEVNKNTETCIKIWKGLTKHNADRKTLLINVGGGVVSDMGGFCASVFKRGIPFINIPTTCLSMADASVGGKTGIDFDSYKNHIGTFCDPLGVFIYSGFCKTQTRREFTNGLAEIVKAGFLADKQLAEEVSVLSASPDDLLFRSVNIKNTIVQKDPKEKNLRKILNFGHTIGHAIESFYLNKKGKQLMHGEAIAIGMICESYIAAKKGVMKQKDLAFVMECVMRIFEKIKIAPADFKNIAGLCVQDKKNKGGKIKLALIEKPGKPITELNCTLPEITESLNYYYRFAAA